MTRLLLKASPHKDSGGLEGTLFAQASSMELLWPLPLLGLGLLGLFSPIAISLAIILALLPWALRWWVQGRLTRTAIIGGPLALWTASALVGLAVAYDRALSWPAILTLWGSISLFFALLNSSLLPRQLSQGVVIVAALVAGYFVGQYAHFNYPDEGKWMTQLGDITGAFLPNLVFFTPHLNAVAGFLEGTLFLSLVLTWHSSGYQKLLWAFLALLIAYSLLITGSRGAWVGLGLAAGFWVFLYLPRPVKTWGTGLMLGAGLLGLYLASDRLALEPAGAASWSGTAWSRLTLYRNSFFLLGDYPFTGIGPGETFAMIYSRYQLLIQVPFLTYPHNLFLAVGLSYGLLGLGALAWLLFNFYSFVFRVEAYHRHSQRSLPLFQAAWLGITIVFIHGLTDSPQFSEAHWTMPLFFGLLALAVKLGRSLQVTPLDQGEQPAYPFRWGVIGLIVFGVAIVAAVNIRGLLGSWYANMGALYQTQADLAPHLAEVEREQARQQAQTYFQRTLALHPTHPGANRRLGMIASELGQFEAAVPYLEQAYFQQRDNQATLKLLGYAYLWAGQADAAEAVLRQLDDQGELVEELANWRGWWATQNRVDLAEAAGAMAGRLGTIKGD